jgi:hypothetical protein
VRKAPYVRCDRVVSCNSGLHRMQPLTQVRNIAGVDKVGRQVSQLCALAWALDRHWAGR